MSMFPSNSLITSILSLVTTGTPYLALYITNPTAADSGTEVTGGSYLRKAITFGSPSGGVVSNTAAVTFSSLPTATITHYGVRSASTAGTLRTFGPLNSTAAAINGDEIVFPVGSIQVTIIGS